MPTVGIKVEGLSLFLRNLKRYAPEVRKEFNKQARAVASRIAAEAKSNASRSERIPGAIAPTVTNRAVGVRLSKKKAPHGALWERGNTRGSGVVRHPLFGNRGFWYSHPARPFLQPAVDANRDDAEQAMRRAIEDAKRKVGLG